MACLSAGLMDACRECGARALELTEQLQERQALPQAQPSLVRSPLQGILQLGQVRRGWNLSTGCRVPGPLTSPCPPLLPASLLWAGL